ncbi:Fidgetin-like protein 1 [Zea mays]|uniref:Fidgetin-like protein 1 n=1 Tax=Zea mays TaxID=4577 RepID=A0A3L6FJG3_MAIZE|nr:Fidgetin-like protein 1 [Zea mays]
MAEPPLAAGCTTNWRREADERLRRLHSLLFGADAALEHGDATVAQALALRLLGFLDSQALAAGAGPEDAAFVAPIRTAASARLAAASRARASDSDRAAFELARTDVGCVFANQGDNNVERIQRSKYFQALLQKSKANVSEQRNAKWKHTGFRSPIFEVANSPSSNDEADAPANEFTTAKRMMGLDVVQKPAQNGPQGASVSPQCDNNYSTRNYGVRPSWNSRRGPRGSFIPPIRNNGGSGTTISRVTGKNDESMEDSTRKCIEMLCAPDGELPEKLRNLEPRLIEHVSNEIMDRDPNVRWNDIAGLEHAKKCVTEMVIWPLLRPDIFRGCRSPGRGLLLFGPPGTGKTMIGKAIAGEAKATFFYISASSLTSKWIGEGEKLVRALFGVASCRQPAVIFVDEIDSLLSQRKSDGEHESSRRLKTQFLIEMEGFDTGNEQILLIETLVHHGCEEARAWIIRNLLEKDGLFMLSEEETSAICKLTEGYSGSDMKNLVKDASMGPLREALQTGVEIAKLSKEDMRPVMLKDFENAMREVRPSVSSSELGTYEEWNRQFGSLSI